MCKPTDKLYVIVRATLNAGLIAAQACHALRAFVEAYPDIDQRWYTHSNNIVVLEHPEPELIATRLGAAGLKVSRFFEPDMGGALTAIAVEPNDGRLLSNLPLAGRRERALLARAAAA